MSREFLSFESLADHHPIDPHQLQGYANAARVRLDVHHRPPAIFEVAYGIEAVEYNLTWTPSDEMLRRSYNNDDDAKRDGAYVIAFATIEKLEDLVCVARAQTKTGADYYLMPRGADPSDLETAVRLEVSGTDGDLPTARYRLRLKQEQTRVGTADGPALAAVVGFKSGQILVDWAL